jgi:hypothetical protein
MIDFKALAAPFPPEAISWRVGSMTKDKTKGMALAYVDARDVMERLDAVCGPAGWQCSYSHTNGKTVCDIGIRVFSHMSEGAESSDATVAEWIWKADGAGDSDIEAEKGALSDAFKRAAVRWGIGRYLYGVESPWVEVDEYKRIKKTEYPRLIALLRRDAGPIGEAVQQNTTQGLAPKAPTKNDTALQAKAWTDAAIGQIELIRVGREIDAWFDANSRALEKLETVHPDQYKRIEAAAAKHRDDVGARLQ